jgi:hypothetical protein
VPSYRVDFLNQFARNEKVFRVCQRSIVVRKAESPEHAIETAKQRFAKLEGIRDWWIHAAMIEIVPITDGAGTDADSTAAIPPSTARSVRRERAISRKRNT